MQNSGVAPVILPVHVLAGGLALVFGYVALYATKGARLHRKSGLLFVSAMVVMALSGALMEALNAFKNAVNVVAGLLTFYFVTTALLAVRRRTQSAHWMDRTAVAVLLPIVAMLYWLWRVRVRQTFRGIATASPVSK